MRAKVLTLSVLSIFIVAMLAVFVSAATILSDDFNDGDLSGWTVTNDPTTLPGTEWTNTGTNAEAKPGSGTSLGTSNLSRTISTSGFQDIVVKYDRQLVGFGTEEEFKASWSTDGTTFVTLEETLTSTPNDGSFVSKTFNLPSSANNNANFEIRFECTSNAQADFCKLDNVVVEGTAIPPALKEPEEVRACRDDIGNPGELRVKGIDFENLGTLVLKEVSGAIYLKFGDDDEWFPLDEIEVELEIENNGDEDVDDVEVEWGIYNTKRNEMVIDFDEEDEVNIKDGDDEIIDVEFNLEDELDVDLDDLDDGKHYRFYVIATGDVDNVTADRTCAFDFENVEAFATCIFL